jgi:phosphosulfolactate synthase
MARAFRSIDIPPRPPKPRERGITMLIDWGIGLRAVEDLLDMAAPFADLAKIAVGISGIMEESFLRRKIALYRQYGIDPFPGGMFLELAYAQGRVREYFRECVAVGYRTVEVSDNVARFPPGRKEAIIREAREEFGLRVLGEVGKKREVTPVPEMIAGVEAALEHGCWKIFVEAAEFFEGKFKAEVIREMAQSVPPDALIFELPGKWLHDIHGCQVLEMMVFLIQELGRDVNVANVMPEDLGVLETHRTNLGVSMDVEGH